MNFSADHLFVQDVIQVLGYSLIEVIYQGSKTVVCRALEIDSSRKVVIKYLNHSYPSFGELAQFRNQYTITQNLSIPGIVNPLALEWCDNRYALIMEDTEGISLASYVQRQSLGVADILAIAIQLADILHDLQQHRVIHKDIKPANILIHPETKQVKLLDFSIASLLPKETQVPQNPNHLEGTLAYMAPEQTGRMNRGIDYRTDFYSLGVTLYHLLSGQLPFVSNDPMDVIHGHIAQVPLSVYDINPQVPRILGALVTKLMAKNAEDRYQGALGLKYDLERCLTEWQTQCQIPAFVLGLRDVSDRFLIPEKLYGREAEIQTLLNAFERVTTAGTSELMLVAGLSGIGKTAVVKEVHKPITQSKGYFIKGKFDQFNRNIPLSAFIQSFRDLVGQLLSESDADLNHWKEQILGGLGENAQVIIDLIPELEKILGPQPSVPELMGADAQNRFNRLFQKIIQVFTKPEHPLVIFIDDLQWADSASLHLIQVLMADVQLGYLLLIGAYRDNEVFPAHPFMLTLDELKKSDVVIHTLALNPLSRHSLNQLIADTLHTHLQTAQPLAELVMQKTQGNPFFATQFLKALHQENLITFDDGTGHWQCDIARVQEMALTDNVVEFMAVQLQKLPDLTQQLLKQAACIGAQFDLETLAIVSEQSQATVAEVLWDALQEGLILPKSKLYKFYWGEASAPQPALQNPESLTYKFSHDRIQQAAYSLISDTQRKTTHWHIGQLLLSQTDPAQRDVKIFDNTAQAMLAYIFNDYEKALKHTQTTKPLLGHSTDKFFTSTHNFYDSLSLIALYPMVDIIEQQSYLDKVHHNQHQLEQWSEHCSTNFRHRFLLVKAELSRITQITLSTIDLYDRAISNAKENGFLHEEALANELAAKCCVEWGKEKFAVSYMQEAYYCYSRWGAEAKVADLATRYPRLLRPILDKTDASVDLLNTLMTVAPPTVSTDSKDNSRSSTTRINDTFDFASILKASQVLSSAIQLDELLHQLTEIILHNSGGDRCAVILPTADHQWQVRAIATPEETRLYAEPLDSNKNLPGKLIQYVKNTQEVVVIDDLETDLLVIDDYLRHRQPKSILCLPIMNHGWCIGIILLENQWTRGVFTEERILILNFLCTQAAIAIENARLFAETLKTEACLRKSQEKLRTTANSLPGLVYQFRVDLEGNTSFPYLSDRATEILEVERDVLEKSAEAMIRCIDPKDLKAYELAITHSMKTLTPLVWMGCLTLPSGRLKWIEARSTPTLQDDGSCLWDGVMLDVSDRQQAEANSHLLASVVESSDDAIITKNLDSTITSWNKAAVDLFGYTEEEAIGQNIGILFPPDRLHEEARIIAQLKNKTRIENFETVRLHKNGFPIDIAVTISPLLDGNGNVCGGSKIVRDIRDRKKAENALRASESRFRTLLSNLDGAVYRCRNDADWTMEFMSDAVTKLSGYPVEDFVNNHKRTFASIIHPDDLEITYGIIECVEQHKPYTLEYRIIHRDGSIRWVTEKGKGIFNDAGQVTHFTGVIVDISDRKAAEAALADSEAYHRNLFEQSSIGLLLCRMNGEFVYANQAFADILGRTTEELPALSYWEITPESYADAEQFQLQSLNEQGRYGPYEKDYIHKNGHLIPVRLSGVIVERDGERFIWSSVEDISDRKAAEQKVLESQTFLQTVLDTFSLSVFWKDRESCMLGANQNFVRDAGFETAEEIVGLTDFDMPWSDAEAKAFRADDQEVMMANSPKLGIIETQIQADGNQVWIETNKLPLHDLDGNVIGVLGTYHDISDRKRAEDAILQKSQVLENTLEKLENAQLQMVQSEKMSALGNLVAGVAHEINNPVGCIVGNVSAAQDYIDDLLGLIDLYAQEFPEPSETIVEELDAVDLDFVRDDLPKLIQAMKDGGDRIKSISRSLRTFSRADTETKQVFDVHEGLDSTVLILRHRLKANEQRPAIEVVKEYGSIPNVACFAGQLNQVFMNILANAIDALDEESQHRSILDLKTNPRSITIRTTGEEKQVMIVISDNGPGMPDEIRAKIFDHLFTTKAVGKGTGLGLAIAHQIVVDTHGGELTVQSKMGQGTEFCICLPI